MCKLSNYGNCDEETKSNEYCIFHKPDKNEEEAREFYEKFLKRFKHHTEIIEDVFSEIRTRYIFEGDLNCEGFVFPEVPEDIDFSFEYAVFEGSANFRGAKFSGGANFRGATFKGYADFLDVTFRKDAYFLDATFWRFTSFFGVTFRKDAYFEEAEFEGYTHFRGATFKGYADFEMTTFKGYADFSIKYERECKNNYKFHNLLNFSNAVFEKSVVIDIPSECFKLPHAEAEARRVQRQSYEKEGKRSDADRMFLLERRALRRAKLMDARKEGMLKYIYELIRVGIECIFADLTCKYGTSWGRAILLWVGVVLFVFPFLYAIFNGVGVSSIGDYFYFSIVTATTLGYGDFHPIGIGKILASIEAIFGTFMWAVYIAVFSRKYMR